MIETMTTGGKNMAYIIQSKNARHTCNTVVAPTGYYRTGAGQIVRDGTPSPEVGPMKHAYHFTTHRAAARCAGKMGATIIREV